MLLYHSNYIRDNMQNYLSILYIITTKSLNFVIFTNQNNVL